MNKVKAGWAVEVDVDAVVPRPCGEEGECAGDAAVHDAVAHTLQRLMDVTVKDAAQTSACWQQRLVQRFAVYQKHAWVKRWRIERQHGGDG